ncbi:hypothetical protein BDQ17DRAFT_284172 [Cyathus striatus]|nr:hypothetical protein BDQ17DRAFT_284172 [Cyathus striatus]
MGYKENNIRNDCAANVKPEPCDIMVSLNTTADINKRFSPERVHVKPEPVNPSSFSASTSTQNASRINAYDSQDNKLFTVKPDIANNSDVLRRETAAEQETTPFYDVFDNAKDIIYAPEDAIKQGVGMVKSIKAGLKCLKLGSKLRHEVWMSEISNLEGQAAPTTLIAVCGATGAGKSSILNAILDDNIVPTSGMRACTAVVTEISYHGKNSIDADVSFLSEQEWRQELGVLMHDLLDEDGNVKRSSDLKSDAGIAWSKVHAVYPTVSQERLVKMSVDQIMACDPKISQILGTTKKIVAKDSKTFAKDIARYIDSKDQRRGDKRDRDKGKSKEKSLMDKVREATGASCRTREKEAQNDADAPALWPLIRQVNVRCSAPALSTGAILVDLPGVADANAARNNIAKDYMKKCNCIWILAPITRAVDDKTARDLLGDAFKMQLMMDGNYDDHTITFIASKCDDISCSEVIRALHLEEDPELEVIEEKIEQLQEDMSHWKRKKSSAEKVARDVESELDNIRNYLREYEAHYDALKSGGSFTPILTAPHAKKRKNPHEGKKGSSKRRRSSLDLSDNDDYFTASDHSTDSDNEDDSIKVSSSENEDDEDEADWENGSVTEESLQSMINLTKESLKATRERLNAARQQRKEARDELATITKNIARTQKDKNAFCSLKRSEFSRDVLKEDFRVGLKDLDDAAAEQRDPNGFNPSINIRDYDAIDLPVFTCSSRDYIRLKGQVKGDGEPNCFSNIQDTGIPDLQKWCHQLTISSRERAARNFLTNLKTFANSIQCYVQGIGDVTVADRESLRSRWASELDNDQINDDNQYGVAFNDPFQEILERIGGGAELYALQEDPKLDAEGNPVGVTPRLCMEFGKLVDESMNDLQKLFKDGLEDKCRVGAANAADAALITTDDFASSMHWATYRATLRRHGTWRRDFNVELVIPFTRNIAHSWGKVFESDLFAPFEASVISSIESLLKDIEESAASGLKDRAHMQAELCLGEARVALRNTLDVVRETMNNEQKEVSRSMAPHIQAQLIEGYDRAMEERGTGSVARQKAYFRGYIDDCKDNIFDDGADVVMSRLTKAADAIGDALDEALGKLAQKVEVNLSVLWEGTRDDPGQVRKRNDVIDIVRNIQQQIGLWTKARDIKQYEASEDVIMG